MSCFTDGLKSEGGFVRYHYILFVQKLFPLMQKVLQTEQLVGHVHTLIDVFCNLLQIVDVSAYESHKRAGKLIAASDKSDESVDTQSSVRQHSALSLDDLVIEHENEVLQLIEGFETILNHCLGIVTAEDTEAARQQERLQQLGAANNSESGLFGWLFGSNPIINFDVNR